ncbi:putative integral membrane protein [Cryptosporidium felis]|nr:putative integral membrane protein [Cryptosporidium felis]
MFHELFFVFVFLFLIIDYKIGNICLECEYSCVINQFILASLIQMKTERHDGMGKKGSELNKQRNFEELVSSEIETIDPDQLFSIFEQNDDKWLESRSMNDLETLIDMFTFILNLELSRQNQLETQNQDDEASNAEEISKSRESATKLLNFILRVFEVLIERKISNFERVSSSILEANNYGQIDFHLRELFFLQELKDLLRNFFFIFKCKTPFISSSPLCRYIQHLYSNTEEKYLSKNRLLNELDFNNPDNWEDVEEEAFLGRHKALTKTRRPSNRRSKRKRIFVGKKSIVMTKLKSKTRRRKWRI